MQNKQKKLFPCCYLSIFETFVDLQVELALKIIESAEGSNAMLDFRGPGGNLA